jgi:ubiquinone biosynthesis protein UbiJ
MERVILFVNHVLLHEPQALARLKRQQGRTLSLKWHDWHWCVRITPAGLLENEHVSQGRAFDRDLPHALTDKSDLTITLAEMSLLDVASRLVHEEKPSIRIEGDVQLAAEVNWLVGHVQWDYEDDLSKIVGDANAHQVVRVAHWVLDGLRRFATSAHDRASALGAGVTNK